jgi:TDG/mug DNA glycosylase family protein
MLRDVLTKNLDVVFCGTAKGKASAALGYYYAGPGNRFYYILHKAGFTPHQLVPAECYGINSFRIGLTDLVHTQAGNDDEIDDESYDVEGFIRKMELYTPRYVAFVGLKSAAFALGHRGKTKHVRYGLQPQTIGPSKVFVLTSTSGSARKFWTEEHWTTLRTLLGEDSQ